MWSKQIVLQTGGSSCISITKEVDSGLFPPYWNFDDCFKVCYQIINGIDRLYMILFMKNEHKDRLSKAK